MYENQSPEIRQIIIDEWRELGFFYDFDDRKQIKEWKFYGSKQGLQNLIVLLDEYISNPLNKQLSEHEHYGPYYYLKILTSDEQRITEAHIEGSINDIRYLKDIISENLNKTQVGQTFKIDKEYGVDNTATLKFFIMHDNFDPASLDAKDSVG
jgi:hypothetical protein